MDPVVSVGNSYSAPWNRQIIPCTNLRNSIWLQRSLRIPDHMDNEPSDSNPYEG